MKTKVTHSLNLKPEERFLFERLPDVVRLEGAMKEIRQKYSNFWDNICRRVQAEHPKLNRPCNHSLDRWAQVGIGYEGWPSEFVRWPSGFYIFNIGLERLGSANAESPSAGIWLKPPKATRVDFETLGESLRRKVEEQLKLKLQKEGGQQISFWYDLPESQQELLEMLTKQKEAQFADCMMSHFRTLTKLVPLIDGAFRIKAKNAR